MKGRILASLGIFSLLGSILIIFQTPPAAGYEISIYDAFSPVFWALIIGSIFIGQLLLLLNRTKPSAVFEIRIGIFLIVLPVLILSALPLLRGYPIYGRADILTHIGHVMDVQTIGMSDNLYPPIHIMTVAISGATGISPITIYSLYPLLFTGSFLGGMYLFVSIFSKNKTQLLLILPIALLPIGGAIHGNMIPFSISLLLIPFILYLFIKEQVFQTQHTRVLLLFSIVGILLYHPLTGLFLGIIFSIFVVSQKTNRFTVISEGPSYIASFTLVVFAAWYTNYTGVIVRFRNIFEDLLGEDPGETELDATADILARTSPEISDILSIAFYSNGLDVMIYGLAGGFVCLGGYLWLKNEFTITVTEVMLGSSIFLFGFIGIVFLTNDFIVGFGRPLTFGKVIIAPLAGSFLYLVIERSRIRSTLVLIFVILILFVLTYAAVFGLYHSPATANTNQQVTQMEIDGMEWFFSHRNEELLIEEFGIDQYRFDHMFHGANTTSTNIRRVETTPPPHFNYPEHDTFGESYVTDRYFLLPHLGRITYTERYPQYEEHWQFTPDDYHQLEHDSSVNRIYDNGDFQIYLIDA